MGRGSIYWNLDFKNDPTANVSHEGFSQLLERTNRLHGELIEPGHHDTLEGCSKHLAQDCIEKSMQLYDGVILGEVVLGIQGSIIRL